MKKKAALIFFVCLISGCAWIGKNSVVSQNSRNDTIFSSEYVQTGKVLDTKRLTDGGNLLIIPFNAGTGVAATDELDTIALMIVKGMTLVLKEEGSSLKVLVADNADTFDMMIKGQVVTMETPKRFKKWVFRKKMRRLGVEGRLVGRDKGRVILKFSHQREMPHDDQSLEQMGMAIGEDIGRFILSSMEGSGQP